MKHLFFVHSHITFVLAMSIIRHENLDKKDCAFIVHRQSIEDFAGVDIKLFLFPFDNYPLDFFHFSYRFWKSWTRLKSLDKYLNYITEKSPFIFYTPQTELKYFALIITHKDCLAFNIVEEGLGSYYKKGTRMPIVLFDLSLTQRLLWKLNFLNRMKPQRYFIDEKYKNIYALSERAFEGYERKLKVNLDSDIFSNLCPQYPSENIHYRNILIFDSIADIRLIDSATCVLSTAYLLNKLIDRGETTLYVKYHPDQIRINNSIKDLKKLFNIYQERITVKELPQSYSIEKISYYKNSTLFVFISSLGFYASLFGCKVYSLAKVASKLYPSFSSKIEQLPSVFEENVEFMEI